LERTWSFNFTVGYRLARAAVDVVMDVYRTPLSARAIIKGALVAACKLIPSYGHFDHISNEDHGKTASFYGVAQNLCIYRTQASGRYADSDASTSDNVVPYDPDIIDLVRRIIIDMDTVAHSAEFIVFDVYVMAVNHLDCRLVWVARPVVGSDLVVYDLDAIGTVFNVYALVPCSATV
jgi:hypothetical protein